LTELGCPEEIRIIRIINKTQKNLLMLFAVNTNNGPLQISKNKNKNDKKSERDRE
jgi:hypothetical protein